KVIGGGGAQIPPPRDGLPNPPRFVGPGSGGGSRRRPAPPDPQRHRARGRSTPPPPVPPAGKIGEEDLRQPSPGRRSTGAPAQGDQHLPLHVPEVFFQSFPQSASDLPQRDRCAA